MSNSFQTSSPSESGTEVAFLATNQDLTWGSYRILVHDLSLTLQELGASTAIVSSVDALNEVSPRVAIVNKSDATHVPAVQQSLGQDVLIGLIQPPRDFSLESIDFAVVVSREEESSLAACEHILFYPLIERLFHNSPMKEHQEALPLKVFYHGHAQHLNRFEAGLSSALDSFHSECAIELHVVTSEEGLDWSSGRPQMVPVHVHKWELSSVAKLLLEADIGIIPNVTDYKDRIPEEEVRIDERGFYHTDYCVRFKNKSNAGRAFVFHQLGIPVIADLTPSHLHLLGNPACGAIASDETGWLRGLRRFRSSNERNEVAKNARDEFNRLYDPLVWGQRFLDQLRSL